MEEYTEEICLKQGYAFYITGKRSRLLVMHGLAVELV